MFRLKNLVTNFIIILAYAALSGVAQAQDDGFSKAYIERLKVQQKSLRPDTVKLVQKVTVTKKIDMSCYDVFARFVESELYSNQDEIKLFINVGYMDDPSLKITSNSSQLVRQSIETYLKECHFNQDTHFDYSRYYKSKLITIHLNETTLYEKSEAENSKMATDEFKNRINEFDEAFYLGHSRNGIGVDFFPAKYGYKSTVNVFNKKFYENVTDLNALNIISCSSDAHMPLTVKNYLVQREDLKVTTYKRRFYFKDAVKVLVNQLQGFNATLNGSY